MTPEVPERAGDPKITFQLFAGVEVQSETYAALFWIITLVHLNSPSLLVHYYKKSQRYATNVDRRSDQENKLG
ncbi:hypothetical protein HanRHA438_Chr14g0668081 [Helianthus annuus]|uniref:Uncharacterized protein n=1 Tax=Helianthus annuus TaxID=4232 RepID=A0A251SSU0_HELAN|nr:hypothetical protein HanXRQr2_Chr14g0657151 [Helianthus annuus]KAJ0469914.1 hypothetical protein HanIR_Chr14g0713081 [Helianthus annuus]KAJ0841417.1 hypothetical protein HanPSC8_Chr14g0630121 [Helianthus annuus]KAJ0854945.1 hypothetical protein HanRHA438_Chr14g0668081 [Helianthus annuus]